MTETQQISPETVTRHVVGQVINSILTRDWVSLEACVDPAIVYWRPGTGDRIDGVSEYIGQWRLFLEGDSELTYRPHTVIVDGETAMIEATAEGRQGDGMPIDYSMVTVMRIAGGRLVEEREYIVPRS